MIAMLSGHWREIAGSGYGRHQRPAPGARKIMNRDRTHFLFLNVGHFLDHLFTLIFATVAARGLSREWDLGSGELLKHAPPGFCAFGVFSDPAAWLDGKGSRGGMVGGVFAGRGLAGGAP